MTVMIVLISLGRVGSFTNFLLFGNLSSLSDQGLKCSNRGCFTSFLSESYLKHKHLHLYKVEFHKEKKMSLFRYLLAVLADLSPNYAQLSSKSAKPHSVNICPLRDSGEVPKARCQPCNK